MEALIFIVVLVIVCHLYLKKPPPVEDPRIYIAHTAANEEIDSLISKYLQHLTHHDQTKVAVSVRIAQIKECIERTDEALWKLESLILNTESASGRRFAIQNRFVPIQNLELNSYLRSLKSGDSIKIWGLYDDKDISGFIQVIEPSAINIYRDIGKPPLPIDAIFESCSEFDPPLFDWIDIKIKDGNKRISGSSIIIPNWFSQSLRMDTELINLMKKKFGRYGYDLNSKNVDAPEKDSG